MFPNLWVANKQKSIFIEEATEAAEREKILANIEQQKRRRNILNVLRSVMDVFSNLVNALKDERWNETSIKIESGSFLQEKS